MIDVEPMDIHDEPQSIYNWLAPCCTSSRALCSEHEPMKW